eukprot:gb/GECG01013749.1/.p1 GENE.gb/GECG01013749.1/~~gb/GECG01013749.1/.p1  ORF type:complete len:132 (+),score=3.54 gb/GECG01013749.1/:1-396(+)
MTMEVKGENTKFVTCGSDTRIVDGPCSGQFGGTDERQERHDLRILTFFVDVDAPAAYVRYAHMLKFPSVICPSMPPTGTPTTNRHSEHNTYCNWNLHYNFVIYNNSYSQLANRPSTGHLIYLPKLCQRCES